ncbi:carbohydrate binding domain-containing protein [Nitrosomonas sp. PY1]|uniref:VanZ family protein n=1 Tax=Nitrosomonas sp. PY1 TaxID=1803906 RepID=UPI001FC7CE82|nr:VanZ family protein [Nitrosomonas sp. PY1]GKS69871.1 carbohydrate binding domain-containing protein [Nitrosomonas sp. PY1]
MLFILLTVITLLAHLYLERFQPTGADLLTASWSTRTSGKNQIDIGKDLIRISSNDPETITSAFQYLQQVPYGQLVMFSAEIKSHDVIKGERPWNTARVAITQKVNETHDQYLPLVVQSLIGTNEWKTYQEHFYIPPDAKTVRFSVELHHATGLLEIRNWRLYPVIQLTPYSWSRDIILYAWGVFFMILIGSCFYTQQKNFLLRFLLVSFFAVIIIGISLPGDIKTFIFENIDIQIDSANPLFSPISVLPWDLSKVGHFVFFLGFGLVLRLTAKNTGTWKVLTIIIMMACGTELVQIYIDGRTPLVSDAFIDTTGGTLGIFFARVAAYPFR